MKLSKIRFTTRVHGPNGFQAQEFALPRHTIVAEGADVRITEGALCVHVWGVPYDGVPVVEPPPAPPAPPAERPPVKTKR